MGSEKSLQAYVFKSAKYHNIYCRKMAAVGWVGFPDILLAHDGRVMLIELKSPTGKGRLSEKQKREIMRLRDAGLNVKVLSQRVEVDHAFKELLIGTPTRRD